MELDYSKISNVVVDYDPKDHPDYCDANIIEADYDGEQMTDEQLEELNEDSDYVHEKVLER